MWLFSPWASRQEHSGVGCYFFLQGMLPQPRDQPTASAIVSCIVIDSLPLLTGEAPVWCMRVKSLTLTLAPLRDRSPPALLVHGDSAARILGGHSLTHGIFPTQGSTTSPALQAGSFTTLSHQVSIILNKYLWNGCVCG